MEKEKRKLVLLVKRERKKTVGSEISEKVNE